MKENNENMQMMNTANVQQANANAAKETAAATTADGGVSLSYSCGQATIHERHELLKEAGRCTMDFCKWLLGVALDEKHREEDARQERYIEKQRKQTAFAEKAKTNAIANAMIKRAEADEKKAEARIREAEAREKEAEARIRESEARIREAEAQMKQFVQAQAKAETGAVIDKKKKDEEEDPWI
jgi:hypothetical protein